MDIKYNIMKLIENDSDADGWISLIDRLKKDNLKKGALLEIYKVALEHVKVEYSVAHKKLMIGLANLQTEDSLDEARKTFVEAAKVHFNCAVIRIHFAQFKYQHHSKEDPMLELHQAKEDGCEPEHLLKKAYMNWKKRKHSLFDGMDDPWEETVPADTSSSASQSETEGNSHLFSEGINLHKLKKLKLSTPVRDIRAKEKRETMKRGPGMSPFMRGNISFRDTDIDISSEFYDPLPFPSLASINHHSNFFELSRNKSNDKEKNSRGLSCTTGRRGIQRALSSPSLSRTIEDKVVERFASCRSSLKLEKKLKEKMESIFDSVSKGESVDKRNKLNDKYAANDEDSHPKRDCRKNINSLFDSEAESKGSLDFMAVPLSPLAYEINSFRNFAGNFCGRKEVSDKINSQVNAETESKNRKVEEERRRHCHQSNIVSSKPLSEVRKPNVFKGTDGIASGGKVAAVKTNSDNKNVKNTSREDKTPWVVHSVANSDNVIIGKNHNKENRNKCFMVNQVSYEEKRIIGTGGSSTVHEVVSLDGSSYALKRIGIRGIDEYILKLYMNEIRLLEKLENEHIVKLHDWELNDESLLLVLEKGDCDFLQILEKKQLTPDDVKSYWRQMLNAVDIIHRNGIVHADLKPANFLVANNMLKLIDFGIANALQDNKTHITREIQMGTLNYMSPEALLDTGGGNISCASDVWSLGCILYLMIFKKTPYSHYRNQFNRQLAMVQRKPIVFEGIPDKDLLDCLQGCLKHEKRDRYSISQLLRHPFLD